MQTLPLGKKITNMTVGGLEMFEAEFKDIYMLQRHNYYIANVTAIMSLLLNVMRSA